MIKVYDNFLDEETATRICDLFCSNEVAWFLQNGVSRENDGNFQFTHKIYEDYAPTSELFPVVYPILNALNVFSIIRIKANLLMRTEQRLNHGYHVDIPDAPPEAKTGVYYINSNNGFTQFESGDKVESRQNRLAIFPNKMRHQGTTNTCKEHYRIVINFNFITNGCRTIS